MKRWFEQENSKLKNLLESLKEFSNTLNQIVLWRKIIIIQVESRNNQSQ